MKNPKSSTPSKPLRPLQEKRPRGRPKKSESEKAAEIAKLDIAKYTGAESYQPVAEDWNGPVASKKTIYKLLYQGYSVENINLIMGSQGLSSDFIFEVLEEMRVANEKFTAPQQKACITVSMESMFQQALKSNSFVAAAKILNDLIAIKGLDSSSAKDITLYSTERGYEGISDIEAPRLQVILEEIKRNKDFERLAAKKRKEARVDG
jgi:hypothetical protein